MSHSACRMGHASSEPRRSPNDDFEIILRLMVRVISHSAGRQGHDSSHGARQMKPVEKCTHQDGHLGNHMASRPNNRGKRPPTGNLFFLLRNGNTNSCFFFRQAWLPHNLQAMKSDTRLSSLSFFLPSLFLSLSLSLFVSLSLYICICITLSRRRRCMFQRVCALHSPPGAPRPNNNGNDRRRENLIFVSNCAGRTNEGFSVDLPARPAPSKR